VKWWRLLVAVACWVLGLLGAVLVMAPVHWLFGDVPGGGRAAAVSGVVGVLLIAVVLPMSYWWHKGRAAEKQRKGFPVKFDDR
jgi:hypothetical protein